jgi:hypothetical protein
MTSISDFLSRIERLRYMMAGTEVQVNETWMRLKIETSLPPEWDSVIGNLSSANHTTVEEVVLFLRKSEMDVIRKQESKDRAFIIHSTETAQS